MSYKVAFLAVSHTRDDQGHSYTRPVLSQDSANLHDSRKLVGRYSAALDQHIKGAKHSAMICAEHVLAGDGAPLTQKCGKHPIYGVGILFNDMERAGRDGLPTSLAVPMRKPRNQAQGQETTDSPTFMIPMYQVIP